MDNQTSRRGWVYFGKPIRSGKTVISSKTPSHAGSRCDQTDRCEEDQCQDDAYYGRRTSSGFCRLIEDFVEWVPGRAILGILDVARVEKNSHEGGEA